METVDDTDLRTLLARVADYVLSVDVEGRLSYANPAFLSRLGREAAEVRGALLADLVPNLSRSARARCLRASQTGRSYRFPYLDRERERWYEVRVYPGAGGITFLALDSTHRRTVERKRIWTEERRLAERVERARSEILSTMSHELRTPLSAMLGYAELLENETMGPLSASQRQYLQRILRQGQRLLGLVNDVLDLARMGRGDMKISGGPRPVEPLLRALFQQKEDEAKSRGIELEVGCSEPGLAYRGDPARVQQILEGLLDNALKFTPEGGRIRVTCTCESNGLSRWESSPKEGFVRLLVEDTGPGIDEALQGSLFRPFVQGDMSASRSHEGTGLSLALGRSLARLMGGDLTLDSGSGGGARFSLWLPRVEGGRRWLRLRRTVWPLRTEGEA